MIGILVVVFLGVVGTVVGGWFLMTRLAQSAEATKRRERILGTKARAATEKAAKVALFEVEEQPRGRLIPTLVAKYNLGDKLRVLADQAGVKLDPVSFVQLSMGCFLAGFALGWIFLPDSWKLYSFFAGVGAGALPLIRLRYQRSTRLKAFEDVFPDTLEFIARSMRAGHAFSVSLGAPGRDLRHASAWRVRRWPVSV